MKAKLKPLPYPPDALVPFLGPETVRIHHGTHQAGYVKGWNKGLAKYPKGLPDYEDLVFNGAGVILHEMYWENLTRGGQGGEPSMPFVKAVARCFGTPLRMIHEMIDIGNAIQGSGWVILAWIPRFQQLLILPIQKHELRWIPGAVPLLVIDVWSHAYYLDYPGNRAGYLNMIWHHVDWRIVSRRFAEASR